LSLEADLKIIEGFFGTDATLVLGTHFDDEEISALASTARLAGAGGLWTGLRAKKPALRRAVWNNFGRDEKLRIRQDIGGTELDLDLLDLGFVQPWQLLGA
jgi:hypothetical protein